MPSMQRVKTLYNECPRYDTKLSDGEVPVMLELWRNFPDDKQNQYTSITVNNHLHTSI